MTAQDPPSTAPPEPACPLPSRHYGQVVMAHGGGGRLARELLETLVQPAFANPYLAARHDSAVWAQGEQRFAFTTDSYVVKPLFFPGGDIGKLAVCGTLNDLAMAGARPLFLSAALILEEGLPLADLQKILESMAQAARAAGTWIVTGDTKVVDRGKGDGLYVNTAGVGLIATAATIAPSAVRPGDAVLLSGDIGRHGIAVLAHREGLAFETALESDCADLSGTVLALLEAGLEVHCLRDLTRGGLAGALFEIAHTAGLDIHLQEPAIAVPEAVRGACEILGLDPLYIANEGRFIAFVPAAQADRALALLRADPLGAGAAHIGQVVGPGGTVQLETAFGVRRVLDLPSGEPLPRIC
ncbi:hydrogenase expression/formation protein HypE [Candidatus Methylocalor cossyra]|uniref:Carbamoyl dehydratase HypE n=1 Tax=Candidatus Methylocalor cossyra TaxID=3108543 RepID=A0ABM9NGU8_9GAMM